MAYEFTPGYPGPWGKWFWYWTFTGKTHPDHAIAARNTTEPVGSTTRFGSVDPATISPYTRNALRESLLSNRTRTKVFIALCGVPLAANQADLMLAIVERELGQTPDLPAPSPKDSKDLA